MKRDTISVGTSTYGLTLDKKTGSLLSLACRDPHQEFLHPVCAQHPLFRMQLREATGEAVRVSALQAEKTSCVRQEDENETSLCFDFKRLAGQLISAHVRIRCPRDDALTYWTIDVENDFKGAEGIERASYLTLDANEWRDAKVEGAEGIAQVVLPQHHVASTIVLD